MSSLNSISLKSPAKVNVYLRVVGKRPDGYHDIVTLFERIDLFDELRFVSNDTGKIRIVCDHPQFPTGPKNLIHKAIRLVQADYGIRKGMTVYVNKRIPIAAGLAGGSSNGATTLLALNRLWCLQLSQKALVSLGSRLGSDVAFFLYNTSWAVGRGRGERIRPVSLPAKLWQVVVVPRRKMYSSEVYGALNLGLTKKRDNVNILLRNLKKNNIRAVGRLLHNDLEEPVFRLCPALQKVKTRVQLLNPQGVMTSGSGPAIYALAQSKREAQQMCACLCRRFSQVFVVGTL